MGRRLRNLAWFGIVLHASFSVPAQSQAQTPTPTVACPAEVLSGTLPLTRNRSTIGGPNVLNSESCASEDVPERSFGFTAPTAGTYEFDTQGSSIDTILYLLDGSCSGAEIDCNDDQEEDTTSRLAAYLTAGQNVVIVVEGYTVQEVGSFTLHVRKASCPADALLGSFPIVINGNTLSAPFTESGSCGGSGRERTFVLRAPDDGTYTFDTEGTSFPVVLHLREDSCSGTEVECSLSDEDAAAYQSQSLARGDTVVVFVDGDRGDKGAFKLTVDFEADPATATPTPTFDTATPTASITPGGACGETLPATLPISVSGSSSGFPNLSNGSCGGAGPERVFIFVAPFSGTYAVDTNGSSYDTVLYARSMGCSGSEIACDDDHGTPAPASSILLPLGEGDVAAIYVDGFFVSGTFQLHVGLVGTPAPTSTPTATSTATATVLRNCPDAVLATPLPIDLAGSTAGFANSTSGSCGGLGPDLAYLFTAPQTATYRIDTDGSDIDTVLYLRQPDCGGSEIACDDDSGIDDDSMLEVPLNASQSVMIFVDTFDGAGGSYQLHVGVAAPSPTPTPLPGDCDGDGELTADDFNRLIQIITRCPACDSGGVVAAGCDVVTGAEKQCVLIDIDGNGCITAAELTRAVYATLP